MLVTVNGLSFLSWIATRRHQMCVPILGQVDSWTLRDGDVDERSGFITKQGLNVGAVSFSHLTPYSHSPSVMQLAYEIRSSSLWPEVIAIELLLIYWLMKIRNLDNDDNEGPSISHSGHGPFSLQISRLSVKSHHFMIDSCVLFDEQVIKIVWRQVNRTQTDWR